MRCELCDAVGGELLRQDGLCRVVLVADAWYPGFCRVILNRHVKEMSDLDEDERSGLMRVVLAVEKGVREVLRPDKVNLASLGNMTPHIHWHVIPRFADDRHFPNSIWGEAQRDGVAHTTDAIAARLRQAIQVALPDV
ncbi:MAG TPA: HIT family protein [Novimethylophilus sp.]|uniref:HIT family protein n=1 Tax=Novimethylophilus sp. TaxID=2137426 RepID=UPI002F420D0A